MKRPVAAVLVVLGLAGPARGDVELGGVTGVRVFSDDNGLGVEDGPDADSQKNTALFGVRFGVTFGRMYGAEAELGVLPGEGRSMLYDVWNVTYRASFVVHVRRLATEKLVPFALVGGGAHTIVSSKNEDAIKPATAPVPHVGIGLKYSVGNGFGVRFDGRLLLPPSSAGGGVTTDFEVLGAIYRDLFWKKPPLVTKEPPPPPPPKDEDPDKDGLLGTDDRCEREPEDPDGFEDGDGCPDPDNDQDGVADAADRCPEPEDRDGFADDDGCPELDNDGDGLVDAADRCAMEPESRNGYLDDDGCADALPEQVQALVAGPQAIAFRPSAAELAPGASKRLDEIAAVLLETKETKELTIEIAVHTDDVPPPKGSKLADNAALSQARAEAVKTYLAGKGVDAGRLVPRGYGAAVPLEDPTGLTGPKLVAAREKNRRVQLSVIVPQMIAVPPPAPPAPAEPAPASTPAPPAAAPPS